MIESRNGQQHKLLNDDGYPGSCPIYYFALLRAAKKLDDDLEVAYYNLKRKYKKVEARYKSYPEHLQAQVDMARLRECVKEIIYDKGVLSSRFGGMVRALQVGIFSGRVGRRKIARLNIFLCKSKFVDCCLKVFRLIYVAQKVVDNALGSPGA